MDESQIDEDFEAFPQRPPPTDAELKAAQKERLAAEKAAAKQAPKVAAAAAKMEQEKAVFDTKEERALLMRRIKQYYAKFGERITTPLPKTLAKQTLEQLQELLRSVELDISCAGATETCAGLLVASLQGVQQLTTVFNPLDLRLSGPRADLVQTFAAQRSTWLPIVEEFAIKYERWFAIGVEKRLLFYLASVILLVNRANKEAPQMEANAHAPADEDVMSKAADLFNELAGQ